jgi:hypothetical protein
MKLQSCYGASGIDSSKLCSLMGCYFQWCHPYKIIGMQLFLFYKIIVKAVFYFNFSDEVYKYFNNTVSIFFNNTVHFEFSEICSLNVTSFSIIVRLYPVTHAVSPACFERL